MLTTHSLGNRSNSGANGPREPDRSWRAEDCQRGKLGLWPACGAAVTSDERGRGLAREIFSLLYVSTASAEAAMSLKQTMRDILLVSDANNRRDGVTGFLLADGYLFAQWLEGPEAAVRACFSRICADERNRLPTVRDLGYADRRLFPDWAMCGLNLSGRDNSLLRPGQIGFDLLEAAPGALRQHLVTLAYRHGPELQRAHAPILGSGE